MAQSSPVSVANSPLTAETVRGALPLAFAPIERHRNPFSLSSLGHTRFAANLPMLDIGSIPPEVNTSPP